MPSLRNLNYWSIDRNQVHAIATKIIKNPETIKEEKKHEGYRGVSTVRKETTYDLWEEGIRTFDLKTTMIIFDYWPSSNRTSLQIILSFVILLWFVIRGDISGPREMEKVVVFPEGALLPKSKLSKNVSHLSRKTQTTIEFVRRLPLIY